MASPFVVRWRNAVMDDPQLSWRAKAAAMPLARHANTNGKDSYPGAGRCAREMSVSQDTIWRGWAELEEAGWMEMQPLPATRRRSQGALKVLRFALNSPADSGDVASTHPLTAANSPADSRSTSEGNQEDPSDPSRPNSGPSGKPCKKHPHVLVDPGYECYECQSEAYYAEHGMATP